MAVAPRPVYQIKVTLEWSKPPIWRRLLVPSTTTLPRFHSILQVAMGWKDCHLHQFLVGQTRYGIPDPEFDPNIVDEHRVPLGRLLEKKGDSLVYEYDFGDGWRHLVELEALVPPNPDLTHLKCVAGEHSCPPEDIGGVPGYEEFLDALRDPAHPDHSHASEWAESRFDQDTFDLNEANARLSKGRLRLV